MTPSFVMPTRVKWAAYVRFQKWAHAQAEDGARALMLDFSGVEIGYPDGIVPLTSAVTELRVRGIRCDVKLPANEYTAGNFDRLGWTYFLLSHASEPPQRMWSALPLRQYSSGPELNKIVNEVIHICLQQLVFAPGVPQALEWVINEIAGNVLDHSQADVGWIQVVTYRRTRTLSIVVADAGIGITRSMRKRFPDISDIDAIQAAIQAGVTSDPTLGQGNGLAGAIAIAEHNHGSFALTSGRARVVTYNDETSILEWFPPQTGTIAELQLSTARPIDLAAALWGHEPVSYIETDFETASGDLVLRLKDQAPNFGNRPTGLRIRNLLMNLHENRRGGAVVVDSSDVKVMSSSFADELFGKLYVALGPAEFRSSIRVEGVNPVCRTIIDRAIAQRVAQAQGASANVLEDLGT